MKKPGKGLMLSVFQSFPLKGANLPKKKVMYFSKRQCFAKSLDVNKSHCMGFGLLSVFELQTWV